MSANFKGNAQYLYNATASGIVPPVLLPQGGDEVENLLTKLLYATVNSAGFTASSGSYTASSPYFLTTTSNGSTPASLTYLNIQNAGSTGALVGGQAFPAGASVTWEASPGTKLSPIAYVTSGNSLMIAGTSLV